VGTVALLTLVELIETGPAPMLAPGVIAQTAAMTAPLSSLLRSFVIELSSVDFLGVMRQSHAPNPCERTRVTLRAPGGAVVLPLIRRQANKQSMDFLIAPEHQRPPRFTRYRFAYAIPLADSAHGRA
jgi:hypothetical protein